MARNWGWFPKRNKVDHFLCWFLSEFLWYEKPREPIGMFSEFSGSFGFIAKFLSIISNKRTPKTTPRALGSQFCGSYWVMGSQTTSHMTAMIVAKEINDSTTGKASVEVVLLYDRQILIKQAQRVKILSLADHLWKKSHISQEKGRKKKSENSASLFSLSCASKNLLLVVLFQEVYEGWDIENLQE